ncbi:alcohol dehydrogenase, iron-containing family protein [Histomonas meleagridis]|uniref:alcohol dehydrogenase, iron-containing family protein n=1 Tax=Histomonas meleagridis TaxID=135588 RepID=UPI003559EB45|nr:alcohol dehydrogenase, iron-containing family protein [Histomonas meleagridis]KAH0799153.1 alcohol dehydrogenase, iron-containing family protein [Histomonas meleagridis]
MNISSSHWLWNNTTQVAFGVDCVKKYIPTFIKPNSRILCTFGGGSIDKNGARDDVNKALNNLNCTVHWEGGIPANPEYERLVEISKVVKKFKPDLILSVGGGSCLDGTKYIALISKFEDGIDPWDLFTKNLHPIETYPVASVMTLPATGSEWNNAFVISRRSINAKLSGYSDSSYPIFSLLDPKYTLTLPSRQLKNGVYDSICHCIDQFLTPQLSPMMDHFWMSVIKELVDIGPDVINENASLELRERLIIASEFASNLIFNLGKDSCWGIHKIGHQLTAKYGIDHGATLSMVTPFFLENQFENRKTLLAQTGAFVFGCEGTEDEMARGFIDGIRKFIIKIGMPTKVSEWEQTKIEEGDLEEVTSMVMKSVGGSYGYKKTITEEDTRNILRSVLQ